VAIRPFVYEKKRFAQKLTDGRTDDGCRAIALAHSWNELKKLKTTVKGTGGACQESGAMTPIFVCVIAITLTMLSYRPIKPKILFLVLSATRSPTSSKQKKDLSEAVMFRTKKLCHSPRETDLAAAWACRNSQQVSHFFIADLSACKCNPSPTK